MASVCVKISSAFVLVLMLLVETDGAGVPRVRVQSDIHLHKHNTTDRLEGMVQLQLNAEALAPTAPVRSLQNSSISPWTYDYTHDKSLFPSHTFAEARCLLSGCLHYSGGSSRLIKQQVLQLRRVQSANGTYYFRLEQRLRAVGCTCVRNTYVQQE